MDLKDLEDILASFGSCVVIWWSAQIDARVEKLEAEVEELGTLSDDWRRTHQERDPCGNLNRIITI